MIKGCFGDGPFSFAGEHYTITDHDGLPKPIQRPLPPLFIGGGGKRRADAGRARGRHRRRSAADARERIGQGGRRSDPRSITVAATEEKLGWVRDAAGDRFDDLEINVYPSGRRRS